MRAGPILGLALLVATSGAPAETLTNAHVLALTREGVAPAVIVASIAGAETAFALDTADLIALKRARVDDAVMLAMLRAPRRAVAPPMVALAPAPVPAPPAVARPARRAAVPARAPAPVVAASPTSVTSEAPAPTPVPRPRDLGVYLVEGETLTPLDPVATAGVERRGFIGYALTGGLKPVRLAAMLPGTAALVRVPVPRPVFRFVLPAVAAGWAVDDVLGDSPEDFALVRLAITPDGREAPVGEYFMAGARLGAPARSRLPFVHAAGADGAWHVTPDVDLPPGEYAFVLARPGSTGMGLGKSRGYTARLFPFAVDAPPAP